MNMKKSSNSNKKIENILIKILGRKGFAVLGIIVLILSYFFGNSNLNNDLKIEEKYEVVRVVDGDTLIVKIDGKRERLRMIGINTPESVAEEKERNTSEGVVASDFVKEMLSNQKVGIEFDVKERDKFGRLLAYVYFEGSMVNKILLKKGYAQIMSIPPNVKYSKEFLELEKNARQNKEGFWSDGKF